MNHTPYRLTYRHGNATIHQSCAAAIRAARDNTPGAVIQDNGDDDCLVWESEHDAKGDDGHNAIARISPVTS